MFGISCFAAEANLLPSYLDLILDSLDLPSPHEFEKLPSKESDVVQSKFNLLFSYASSSTLHPRQSVSQ